MNSTNTQTDFLSFSPLNKSLQSLHYIALKHIRQLLLLFAFAISLSLSAQTKTYYVDAAKANNDGEGTSWATAKKDLQVALDLADAGDEIRVAAGTYLPTDAPNNSAANRDKAFHLNGDVVLKGSYDPATDMQDYNNPSILSGDFMENDVITGSGSSLSITMNTENAYHVFVTANLSSATIIDGFFSVVGMPIVSVVLLIVHNHFSEMLAPGCIMYLLPPQSPTAFLVGIVLLIVAVACIIDFLLPQSPTALLVEIVLRMLAAACITILLLPQSPTALFVGIVLL